MVKPPRSIFRDSALKHYIQRREKDILPRIVSPPVFVFYWLLLCLLIIAGLLVWWGEVPTYVAGVGVVLDKGRPAANQGAVAVVFLPATAISASKLRTGLPVLLQIGSTGPHLTSKIEKVEPGVLSPNEARKHYALNSSASPFLTQPSVVVTVRLGSTIPAHTYAGSVLRAQVQIGSRRVLSLLPGLDRLIGA